MCMQLCNYIILIQKIIAIRHLYVVVDIKLEQILVEIY